MNIMRQVAANYGKRQEQPFRIKDHRRKGK